MGRLVLVALCLIAAGCDPPNWTRRGASGGGGIGGGGMGAPGPGGRVGNRTVPLEFPRWLEPDSPLWQTFGDQPVTPTDWQRIVQWAESPAAVWIAPKATPLDSALLDFPDDPFVFGFDGGFDRFSGLASRILLYRQPGAPGRPLAPGLDLPIPDSSLVAIVNPDNPAIATPDPPQQLIPEPQTLVLFCSGITLLLAMRRRV